MTWTGQTFAVGQILTAAQMTNLQADITALANGDTGAPDIVEAALAAAVVAQLVTNGDSHDHSGGDGAAIPVGGIGSAAITTSKLNTSTTSLAGTIASTAGTNVAIVMANYAFFPMIHCTNAGANAGKVSLSGHLTDGASADSARFSFQRAGSGSGSDTYDVDYRSVAT